MHPILYSIEMFVYTHPIWSVLIFLVGIKLLKNLHRRRRTLYGGQRGVVVQKKTNKSRDYQPRFAYKESLNDDVFTSSKNYIEVREYLKNGDNLTSENGIYVFGLQQDGHLVIRENGASVPLWGTTLPYTAGASFVILESNADLVQYVGSSPDRQGRRLWHSNSPRYNLPNSTVVRGELSNEGIFTIWAQQSSSTPWYPLWSTAQGGTAQAQRQSSGGFLEDVWNLIPRF